MKKNFPFKSSNNKKEKDEAYKGTKILSKISLCNDNYFLYQCNIFFKEQNDAKETFDKILYNGIIYETYNSKTKRCDACFFSENESIIGLIQFFFMHSDEPYAYAKKVVSLYNPFFSETVPGIKSKLRVSKISDEFFIQPLSKVQKCVLIETKPNETFVSTFSSSHLFT